MKIIGDTENGFILEASKDEVANLKGFYSDYNLRSNVNNKELESKIGGIIEIEPIYSRYRTFESIIKSTDFSKVLDRLKDTVEVLTSAQELFNQTKEIIK